MIILFVSVSKRVSPSLGEAGLVLEVHVNNVSVIIFQFDVSASVHSLVAFHGDTDEDKLNDTQSAPS
jgi:hypothetical protein